MQRKLIFFFLGCCQTLEGDTFGMYDKINAMLMAPVSQLSFDKQLR